jgi:hypothetical protein
MELFVYSSDSVTLNSLSNTRVSGHFDVNICKLSPFETYKLPHLQYGDTTAGLNKLKSVPHIRLYTKSYMLINAMVFTCKMLLY